MPLHDLPGALAVIRIGIDPILFHIGRFGVHWYGIMYAIAFLAAFRWGVVPHLRTRGIPQATLERLTAWTILFGLLGARIYYVVQQSASELKDYAAHPLRIIAVWEGGMAFFGAVVAGLAAIWVLARRNSLSFWLLADAGVLFAAVGQPIGRIGNIINGDILGPRSDLPWATAYTFHTNPGQCAVLQPNFFCGVGYQPAGLYEGLGTLVILGVLLLLRRRRVRDGILAIGYVALYALSQLLIFQYRSSEPTVFRGLKQAQVTAIVLLIVGVPLLYALWRKSPEAARPAPPPPAKPARKERKSSGTHTPEVPTGPPAGGKPARAPWAPPAKGSAAAAPAAPFPTQRGTKGRRVQRTPKGGRPSHVPPPPPTNARQAAPPLPPVNPIPPPPPKSAKSDA